jgi:pimeloyl-ACP methyl ester carboxylesterase
VRFVLVHGAMHGGWCWRYVVEELAAFGVSAIAPDLPGHGTRIAEVASLDGYRDALVEVIRPDDVLVGHSLGGTFMTLAADVVPEKIRHLIYIASPVPEQGRSLVDVMPFVGSVEQFQISEHDYSLADAAAARSVFYNDCTDELVDWAFSQIQPQALGPLLSPIQFTRFWDTAIPRDYILCLDDRTGVLTCVESYLKRLNLSSGYPVWTSHFPLLSRPRELARLMCSIAQVPLTPAAQGC